MEKNILSQFLSLREKVAPIPSAVYTSSYASAAQWQNFTSSAFSSTPKHSPAEIKLPNFQKQFNHFQVNIFLYFLHQMNNKKAGILKHFCSGRKQDKPGTDSLAEQNSAPVMYLSSSYPFVSSNTQGHTEQEALPFPSWWLTVKSIDNILFLWGMKFKNASFTMKSSLFIKTCPTALSSNPQFPAALRILQSVSLMPHNPYSEAYLCFALIALTYN